MAQADFILANSLIELDRLAAEVGNFCRANGIDSDVTFNITLAFEELISNTINYGYDPGHSDQIRVSMRIEDGWLTAHITDCGRAFDPLQEAPEPDLDAAVEDRAIGGLGVHLVRTVIDSVSYRRDAGCNVITLHTRTAATAPAAGTAPAPPTDRDTHADSTEREATKTDATETDGTESDATEMGDSA